MKIACLKHDLTHNLGDDIQAYAAAQIVTPDIYLERDRLGDYADDGPIVLICNGWFGPNWTPPPPNITPVFVGFHANCASIIDRDYFKQHEPIGCRDPWTVTLCRQKGVDAFFTGCLTLTLPARTGVRSGVYAVDRALLAGVQDCRHVTHDTRVLASPAHRREAVKWLLGLYASAEHVYTSRLHAALPCVAFGTPVSTEWTTSPNDHRWEGLDHLWDNPARAMIDQIANTLRCLVRSRVVAAVDRGPI